MTLPPPLPDERPGQLCQGCLDVIRDGPIPLCNSCFEDLQSLGTSERLARIAEMIRNQQLRRLASGISEMANELTDLISLSRQMNSRRK